MTDEAIRTFGRKHMTELMANLPPLPEEAWMPPARKEVTIMTDRDPKPGICGHPGSKGGVCGLIPGHSEPHRPVHVIHVHQDPAPIRDATDMVLRYPGMMLAQAVTLLAEADQAHARDPAETLGVFIREERDPVTRALIYGQRLKITRQDGGSYRVTVTDEAGRRSHDPTRATPPGPETDSTGSAGRAPGAAKAHSRGVARTRGPGRDRGHRGREVRAAWPG